MGDRILLNGMTFYGYHGVRPEEKELGQRFVVDVEMELDLRAAGTSDDLTDTVDYSPRLSRGEGDRRGAVPEPAGGCG